MESFNGTALVRTETYNCNRGEDQRDFHMDFEPDLSTLAVHFTGSPASTDWVKIQVVSRVTIRVRSYSGSVQAIQWSVSEAKAGSQFTPMTNMDGI